MKPSTCYECDKSQYLPIKQADSGEDRWYLFCQEMRRMTSYDNVPQWCPLLKERES